MATVAQARAGFIPPRGRASDGRTGASGPSGPTSAPAALTVAPVASPPQEPVSAAFAQRIRAERQARGISQEQLARGITRAGYPIARHTLMEIEIGRKREAGVGLLVALSRVLRLPLEELLGLDAKVCTRCHGRPPAGFACLACGTEAGR